MLGSVAPVSGSGGPATSLPSSLQELLEPRRYRGRFAALYLLLAVVAIGSAAAFALLTIAPRSGASRWAAWSPPKGAPDTVVQAIARHVARDYRIGARHQQLVTVLPSAPPVVVDGTQKVSVSDIAMRTAGGAITTIDANGGVTYTLCGLGRDCATAEGPTGLGLLRREALELALYTFRFVPSVKTVVAFIPSPSGNASCVLFQEPTLTGLLHRPLDAALRASTAGARGATHDFHFSPLPTGGAILILDTPHFGAFFRGR